MYASNLPHDNLFDSYIDPAVYKHSQNNTALPSLETDSSGPSSYASPHYAPHIPHTTTHHAPHTYSAALNCFGNETGPLYLLDQESFETELSTTFGSSHVEERSAEEDMLGPYQAFVSKDMDHDIYPFLRGEVSGETWYDRDMNANTADNSFEDSATYCTSPSTTSTSEVDTVYSERTSMSSRNPRGSNFRSYRFGRSHTSRPSFGMSAHWALSTPSAASEHNYSALHLCHLCNRSFTLPKDLKRHMKSIHDQERFQCPVSGCRLEFTRKDKLLQHRRTHSDVHSGVQEDSASSRPPSVFYGGSLGSDIGSIPTPSDYSDSGYNWDLLGKDFSSAPPSHLGHSNEDKNKRVACPHCKQGFNLQHDRLRHMRTLHSSQENGIVYRCAAPGCAKWDKMWTRLDNFKKHLAKQHGAESMPELVQKSRTLGSGDAFTVTTPEMFSQ